MNSVSDLYEPLIERDLAAIPSAVREFRKTNDSDALFLAIARFSVLAFAPSEHSRHALLATLAAHDLRADYGERWEALVIECARYIAATRQPWSEPPLLDPPVVDAHEPRDVEALRGIIEGGDRLAGERWLAARLDDRNLERDLVTVASDDLDDFGGSLITTAAVLRLAELLGEKGRYAVLRVAIWQLVAARSASREPMRHSMSLEPAGLLAALIAAAAHDQGSLESIHRVLLFDAAIDTGSQRALGFLAETSKGSTSVSPSRPPDQPPVYPLARDYAQTLLAHAAAKRLRTRFPEAPLDAFIAAAEFNRQHGDSFDEWTLA